LSVSGEEIGLPVPGDHAREERASIACASNAPSPNGATFTDPRLAAAVVDRLTFNAHIIQTGTSSHRFDSTQDKKGAAHT
jgi:hypothetical protein